MSQSSSATSIRDLTASFEQRSKPATTSPTLYSYRSDAADLANMAAEKRKLVPSLAQSIDAVLESPATKPQPPVRPLVSLRPSWIGPARSDTPKTPGVEAMKQHITVEYASPGLQPPVYIFTNLSEPQWEAVEMQAEKGLGAQYKFFKTFVADEGEYQYKFRLGPGEWWVYDNGQPTIDDGMGNKNNLLVVKPAVQTLKQSSSRPEPAKPGVVDTKAPSASNSPPKQDSASSPTPLSPSELLKMVTKSPAPEDMASSSSGTSSQSKESVRPSHTAFNAVPVSTPGAHQPAQLQLTSREVFAGPSGAQSQQTPERERANPVEQDPDPDVPGGQNGDDSSTSNGDESGTTGSDCDDSVHPSPLLRHESLRPNATAQHHAPLFRHESISIHNNRPDLASITMSPAKVAFHGPVTPHIPHEADPEDTSLEPFPTTHAAIIKKIHHTATTLPADELSAHESSVSSPSLASVCEESTTDDDDDDAEEELERIREAEEEEVEREEASGEEMDPLTEADAENEPEDYDFQPNGVQDVEVLVIEVVERPVNFTSRLMEMVGSPTKSLALAAGLLILAASIAYMQLSPRS